MVTLLMGVFHDRRILSSCGASFDSRTLPLDALNKLYKVYEVLAPIHADAGPAIPWFNQPGKGTQLELSEPISQLLAEGKIREIGG
jgi:hypothetical protein